MIICYFLELGGTKTTLLITTCFLYGAAFCDITVTAKDCVFLCTQHCFVSCFWVSIWEHGQSYYIMRVIYFLFASWNSLTLYNNKQSWVTFRGFSVVTRFANTILQLFLGQEFRFGSGRVWCLWLNNMMYSCKNYCQTYCKPWLGYDFTADWTWMLTKIWLKHCCGFLSAQNNRPDLKSPNSITTVETILFRLCGKNNFPNVFLELSISEPSGDNPTCFKLSGFSEILIHPNLGN